MTSSSPSSSSPSPASSTSPSRCMLPIRSIAHILSARVCINISGEIYETVEKTIQKYPKTLLGDVFKRKQYFCQRSQQYFFNRNRQCFEAILYFYQSNGILSKPSNIRMDVFLNECLFFELPEDCIQEMKLKEGLILSIFDKKIITVDNLIRSKIWNFLEKPETSKASTIYAIVSLSIIALSVLVSCIETLPIFRMGREISLLQNPWRVIDLSLNAWFLIEFCVRLSFSMNKWKFMKQFLNIVDFISVFPYFIKLSFTTKQIRSLGFIKLLRFTRVIRLFRLSKHSVRIKLVTMMLKSSLPDFQVLMLCWSLVVVFGGNILYFIELSNPDSQFTDIPQSLWWALQTATTVGYGDIVPITGLGKLLASLFMVFGALTVSLPVLTIITKFSTMYSSNIEGFE